MSDIKTPEERSKNMSAIRSKDTKPEVFLRKLLFSEGYRYRKNVNYIFGHPDIFLARYRTAIFIHGCFWHRHEGCKYAYLPKSHVDYWRTKFARNMERDIIVKQTLSVQNIKCLVIWECTVKKMQKNELLKLECLNKIKEFFSDNILYMEL